MSQEGAKRASEGRASFMERFGDVVRTAWRGYRQPAEGLVRSLQGSRRAYRELDPETRRQMVDIGLEAGGTSGGILKSVAVGKLLSEGLEAFGSHPRYADLKSLQKQAEEQIPERLGDFFEQLLEAHQGFYTPIKSVGFDPMEKTTDYLGLYSPSKQEMVFSLPGLRRGRMGSTARHELTHVAQFNPWSVDKTVQEFPGLGSIAPYSEALGIRSLMQQLTKEPESAWDFARFYLYDPFEYSARALEGTSTGSKKFTRLLRETLAEGTRRGEAEILRNLPKGAHPALKEAFTGLKTKAAERMVKNMESFFRQQGRAIK